MNTKGGTRRAGARLRAIAALVVVLTAAWPGARAADVSDRRADDLFETAMSAYELKRYEDSATKFYDFMAAAPNDPRNDVAQYYVGRAFMHRNYLNKAIEEFEYIVEDFPDSNYTTLGLHDLSECYLETRRNDKAVEVKEQVIKRPVRIYHGTDDPMLKQLYENHRHDVFWLAKQYLDKKQYEAAIAAYRHLPYEIEAFRHVVNVYYGLGEFEKIKQLIDGLQDKNRHEGFKFLIEFYGKSKAYNQLQEIFAKLLQEKEPTRATDDLVWTTAWSFNNFGRDKWDWAMNRLSDHYPRMARRADYEMAKHHWQELAYQDAMELFVIKYQTGGDVDDVLRWKGITLERHARAEEARKDYRRMGNAGQGHWYAAESYHGGYASTKDPAKAIEEYTELRKAFYGQEWSAMAQWRIGQLHRQMKKPDEAIEAYRHAEKRFKAVRIDDGRWSDVLHRSIGLKQIHFGPASQLALADVMREANRYDDAIMEYKILISRYPKETEASTAAYRVALCYEGKEDPDTAILVLKSVLRRYGKTVAGSDAHTLLETKYDIADTEVSDTDDFFVEGEIDGKDRKNYLEAPEKMLDDRRRKAAPVTVRDD